MDRFRKLPLPGTRQTMLTYFRDETPGNRGVVSSEAGKQPQEIKMTSSNPQLQRLTAPKSRKPPPVVWSMQNHPILLSAK
jgi:hypothetical protein